MVPGVVLGVVLGDKRFGNVSTMQTFRTFVAIKLPPTVRRTLEHSADEFQCDDFSSSGGPVRWMPAENLHLTLKFLGDVDDVETASVCQIVAQTCRDISPFDLTIGQRTALPSIAKPRTLVFAVADSSGNLTTIVDRLEKAFAAVGYRPEPRDYVPHITAARPRGGGRRIAAELVDRWIDDPEPIDAPVSVESVEVVASVLDKQGPTYHTLSTHWLNDHADSQSSIDQS